MKQTATVGYTDVDFSGVLQNVQNYKDTLVVTNGHFNSTYTEAP